MDARTALLTLLDHVDYTSGACRPNEMIGAALPKEVVELARQAAQQIPLEDGATVWVCDKCKVDYDVSQRACISCGKRRRD